MVRIYLLFQDIAKNVVSLLNGDGGILVYGVRSNGIIYGQKISRKERDTLTNSSIDNAIKKIIPCVSVDLYSVIFTDVIGAPSQLHDADNKVVRIKVAPGRPGEMYEDLHHEVCMLYPFLVAMPSFPGTPSEVESKGRAW